MSFFLPLSLYFQSKNVPLTPIAPAGCRSSSQLLPVTAVRTTAGSLRLSLEGGRRWLQRKSVCVCEIICLCPHVNTLTLCKSLCVTSGHSLTQLAAEQQQRSVHSPCVSLGLVWMLLTSGALPVFALQQLQMCNVC